MQYFCEVRSGGWIAVRTTSYGYPVAHVGCTCARNIIETTEGKVASYLLECVVCSESKCGFKIFSLEER